MTRVNVVDPKLLLDQHLLAEIRELPRMITYTEKHYKFGMVIPKEYTLNTGHMKFFVDKAGYVLKRQIALVEEYTKRGFSVNFDLDQFSQRVGALHQSLRKDYIPTTDAISINVERLLERVNAKPDWYRYIRSKIAVVFILGQYHSLV